MKARRFPILLLSFPLLGGCLVGFTGRIDPSEAALVPLLGAWSRRNEGGEWLALEIRQIGPNRYRARQSLEGMDDARSQQQAEFSMARHGWRWYLSAGVPDDLGGGFLIPGFELTAQNGLVLSGAGTNPPGAGAGRIGR